ncbi:thioesterase family protein [Hellea balneolensis]|uniref:thioesterase family protein n=1 Tax=Hellea balneolensis TaxID=287478 RepID=UPI0003FF715F|nr:thioesterase family protein [Hellea balneolensis]
MTGFNEIANKLTVQGEGYAAHIPEDWRQGRTAYGGLTAGLSLAAAQKQFPDLPPFRSVTVNFIGPVSGPPVFTSRLLRQGRNVTSIETEGRVEGKVVSSCTFIFAGLRDSSVSVDCAAPAAPAPKDCEPFTPPGAEGFVPAFFNRFETKLIEGARPMSGADRGYIRTWSRHADPASREGIASLLTLGDVLPPSAAPLFKQLGAISSVNWIFTVLMDDPKTNDGWWQVETDLTAAAGGYSSQVMRIWNTDGELAAEGMQCVAIFM